MAVTPDQNNARILVILTTLGLLHALIYSTIIPPWQGPDEPKHFEYVWLLYEKRRLISIEDASLEMQQAIIASMQEYDFGRFGTGAFDPLNPPQSFKEIWGAGGANTLLHRPPLYYLISLPVYSIVANEHIVTRLYALRFFSALLGTLTVLTAYLTAKELFPNDPFLHIGIPSLVALLPMVSFISGAFSYDTLANLLVSLIWYLVVLVFSRGSSWQRVLGIAALVIGAAATKRTTLSTIPLLLLAAFFYLWMTRKRRTNTLRIAVIIMTGAGLLLSFGAFGWVTSSEEIRAVIATALSRYLFNYPGQFRAILSRLPEMDLATSLRWVQRLFISFWADFGWLKVRLAPTWYIILAVVCMASVGGLFLFVFRQIRGEHRLEPWKQRCLLLFGLYVVTIVVASALFFSAYIGTKWERAPQGRHLFLGIVPFTTLFTLGLGEWVPVQRRQHFLAILMGLLVAFDLLALVRYIIPYFYR